MIGTVPLPFDENTTRDALAADGTTRLYDDEDGKEFIVSDHDWSLTANSQGGRSVRSAFLRRIRLVYNASAISLLAKMLVQFQTTSGKFGRYIIGYQNNLAGYAFPVSEWCTSIPSGHQGYIVTGGPAMCINSATADVGAHVDAGTRVAAESAAASTHSTTAGRVRTPGYAVTEAVLANVILNNIGFALSAKTSANTNTDLLVLVNSRW